MEALLQISAFFAVIFFMLLLSIYNGIRYRKKMKAQGKNVRFFSRDAARDFGAELATKHPIIFWSVVLIIVVYAVINFVKGL